MTTDERIGARNRRTILRAATQLFSRKGFAGTRIVEIAQAAGLPKANVYYYFPSKAAIYAAIIQRLIAGWDGALAHITADSEPRAALEAYVRAKLDYSRRNAAESRMFATEILGGARFLSQRDRRHMREATARHSAVIEGWIAAGRLRPVDPRHLFVILWSATQFYTDFETLAADALEKPRLQRADFEGAAAAIVQTVIGGLLAAPGPERP